jgi:arginase
MWNIVGYCSALGSLQQSVSSAPIEIRNNDLLVRLKQYNQQIVDGPNFYPSESNTNSNNNNLSQEIKNSYEIFELGQRVYEFCLGKYAHNEKILLLGGDHSASIFNVSALATSLAGNAKIGVLWIDAHPDLNTPQSSLTGNLHGMSLAHLTQIDSLTNQFTQLNGRKACVDLSNIVYIGLRSVDLYEKNAIKNNSIKAYSMHEIDKHGIYSVCKQSIDYISARATHIVVSFDLDVIDPRIAPGVGTPVRGGLTFREAHTVLELLAKMPSIKSFEMIEYSPTLDNNGETVKLAVELLESFFGKSIL